MSTVHTLSITKTADQKLAHIAEECAEFIKAYCKYQRFGARPLELGVQYDNIADMHRELNDIIEAIDRYKF